MDASLKIGRLRTACHVAGSRFAPAVRDRASSACRQHLPIALRAAAHSLGGNDDSVWIVRRIELSVLTRIDADAGDIALSISGCLGRALARVLIDDGDGTNAIRFRSRGAYLARFVVDVAAGTAWTRWYFAPLSGWRRLPASAAIRSAIVQDPSAGLAALRTLDDREFEQVVECLTGADEDLILAAVAGVSVGSGPSDEEVTAPQARRPRSTNSIAVSRPLVRHFEAPTATATPVKQSPSISESAYTRFGGLALLLRDLNALPWKAYTAGWPQPGEQMVPETYLRWLTLAVCSGHARADAFLADDVWRDLTGIPRALSLRDVATWLRAVGSSRRKTLDAALSAAAVDDVPRLGRRWLAMPQATGISRQWGGVLASVADSVYAGFARRLPGFADSPVDFLWHNFLDVDAVIEQEGERMVVRCGRGPLHLVLALTGMTRGLVVGTDPAGRPLVVFSRE